MPSVLLSGPAGRFRKIQNCSGAAGDRDNADHSGGFYGDCSMRSDWSSGCPAAPFPFVPWSRTSISQSLKAMRLRGRSEQARRRGFDVHHGHKFSDGDPAPGVGADWIVLRPFGRMLGNVIVDPVDRATVTARLSDPVTGSLAPECATAAISRWYRSAGMNGCRQKDATEYAASRIYCAGVHKFMRQNPTGIER